MIKTYEIRKGGQYDREGAVVEEIRRSGYRLRVAYGRDGLRIAGDVLARDAAAAVEAAVLRVIASGQSETVTVGERAVPKPAEPEWHSPRGLTLSQEMDRADTNY